MDPAQMDQNLYEVRNILMHRGTGLGTQFLVEWVDPGIQPTWETYEVVKRLSVLRHYVKKHGLSIGKHGHGRPKRGRSTNKKKGMSQKRKREFEKIKQKVHAEAKKMLAQHPELKELIYSGEANSSEESKEQIGDDDHIAVQSRAKNSKKHVDGDGIESATENYGKDNNSAHEASMEHHEVMVNSLSSLYDGIRPDPYSVDVPLAPYKPLEVPHFGSDGHVVWDDSRAYNINLPPSPRHT